MGRMHAEVYGALPGVELVRICSDDAEHASKLADRVGLPIEPNWKDVVADPSLDVIDICLPTHLHAEVSVAALQADKDVFCEKPMALSVAEGQQMVDAANRSGRKLMIGHCIRFWPEYEHLTSLIESKELGELTSLNMTRYGEFPSWSSRGWIGKPELSGGAALDMHIHDTDYAVHHFGKPDSMTSRGTVDARGVSQIFTTLTYGSKVVHLEGGWNLPPKTPFKMAFRAIFENGAAIFDGGPLTVYPASGEPYAPAFEKIAAASGGNISDLGGYYRELSYFFDQLESGGNLDRVRPESALASLEVTLDEIAMVKAHA
jgi:predicted dehydrogenase